MTSPITQLEIAAQWLQEVATHLLATSGNTSLRKNLERVATECRDVVRKENT